MDIKVWVYQRPNMFAVNDNTFNMVGYCELKRLFAGEVDFKVPEGSKLQLFYPERFLNVVEERQLVFRAEKAGYESLEITTHSVYIIQTIHSENIKIVHREDCPLTELSDNGKLSYDWVGMPDDSGLSVIFGSK
jgi:hypothetical protein